VDTEDKSADSRDLSSVSSENSAVNLVFQRLGLLNHAAAEAFIA
jgi:hypothetical protein